MTGFDNRKPVFSRDAVACSPRPNGVDGNCTERSQRLSGGGLADDLSVGSHAGIMRAASFSGKCQMHYIMLYGSIMSTMSERLKKARESAGFAHAKDAAEAMGLSVPTYIQHENGTRNYPRDPAERYAKFFRSTPEWLLYGRGQQINEAQPSVDDLERMLQSVMNEVVTVQTKISDLPRICAASLFEQLLRFSIDRSPRGHSGDTQQSPANDESRSATN